MHTPGTYSSQIANITFHMHLMYEYTWCTGVRCKLNYDKLLSLVIAIITLLIQLKTIMLHSESHVHSVGI